MAPLCTGTDLSFSITNITGNPEEALTIKVYKKFTNVEVASVTVNPFPVTASYYFDKSDHAFLRTSDEYQIQITQVEETSECFEIKSALKDYTVPFELNAGVGAIVESYPDIPTGKLSVLNFTGGVMPYDVSIELDSASSLGLPVYETDFEEVELNLEQQLVKPYENLPPGRYAVQIIDSVGCSIELLARVPMDIDLVIPNVMTPNEDGVNDIFFIRNLATDVNNKLVISNRWGKEVYSSTSYQNNWTGEGAADGIYFYRLQVNGNEPRTGWVEIMRGQKP
jgi:gliding motility-associated-like protein